MSRVCLWCWLKEAWRMEMSGNNPWRKILQMPSSCQVTSGCCRTSQNSPCLTAWGAWRPLLCSRSASDSSSELCTTWSKGKAGLMSKRWKNKSCLSAPSQAIHMETDPQTISAYLIYLSQHAPVEEQASHNDLALVITSFVWNQVLMLS